MNYRTLIIFFLIIAGFLSVVLVGFMVTYSIDPSLLGFEPKRTKSDSLRIENEKKSIPTMDKYIISQKQFENLQDEMEDKDSLLEKRKLKAQISSSTIDSLKKLLKIKDSLLLSKDSQKDTVKLFKTTLDKAYKDLSSIKDSVSNLEKMLAKAKQDISLKDAKIAQQEKFFSKKVDTLSQTNFRQFADIFKSTNPAEVAKILVQIDERDAAKILKLLPKKQAGKVIAELPPERAAVIMLLGAGQ